MPARRRRKPNILLIGDRLPARRPHELLRLPAPHHASHGPLRRRAARSSSAPSAPTSPPPAAMPPCSPGATASAPRWWPCATRARCGRRRKTLAEILREAGYNTTSRRLQGQPRLARVRQLHRASPAGARWADGRSPKAQNLNDVTVPELDRLAAGTQALLPLPAPHGPALALPAARSLRAHVLPRQRVRPGQHVHGAGLGLQALPRLLRLLDAARHHRQGLRHRPVRRRRGLHGRLHPDHLPRNWRTWASSTTPSSSSTPTTARRSTTTTATSTTTASTTTPCTSR